MKNINYVSDKYYHKNELKKCKKQNKEKIRILMLSKGIRKVYFSFKP